METKRAEIAGVALLMTLALMLTLTPDAVRCEQLRQIRGVIRVHSQFSTGSESVESLARKALAQSLDVLVLTDVDLLRVEYSMPVLQRLLRFRVDARSLRTRGTLDAYLSEIRRVQRLFPELILIDGVESVPFYYWGVDWTEMKWRLHRWDQHLLAVGLASAGAYAGLPVAGSDALRVWNWRSFLLLWPLGGLAYARLSVRWHPPWLRWSLGVVALVLLASNFPFKLPLWDAYGGDVGVAPYRVYTEYVRSHGGAVLCAYPSSGFASGEPPVAGIGGRIIDIPSPGDALLVQDSRCTAFGGLATDRGTATEPGRQWDRLLREAANKRPIRAVWVEGENDYPAGSTDPAGRLRDVQTVFLVRERSIQGVLEAMKAGRMYACRGKDVRLRLERFRVTSERAAAVSGGHLTARNRVRVDVDLSREDGAPGHVKIRLIRAGHVVKVFTAGSPCEIHYVDSSIRPETHTYYRLLASAADAELVSNPIFVTGVKR